MHTVVFHILGNRLTVDFLECFFQSGSVDQKLFSKSFNGGTFPEIGSQAFLNFLYGFDNVMAAVFCVEDSIFTGIERQGRGIVSSMEKKDFICSVAGSTAVCSPGQYLSARVSR